ncbi:LbetaH domain-containing protein [Flavobacterium agrisoli]|uniref:Acyltransferase n=1 Tax=Flavobacterium agrisoli TaxID=2793066 RepID=A0A934PQK8_9FLAO|nr:acyltransferase [Flavobacterium agrisoli]MBK0371270.1 acyltransferase [Flavobacterium agrisoli]
MITKKVIRKILISSMRLIYFVFSPIFFNRLVFTKNQLYSFWKSNEFKTTGKKYFFQYPLYLHGGKYITIGENFNCGLRLRLEAYDMHLGYFFSPKIIIGNNVSINHDCHIGAINEIEIGDGVLIASKVFITDHYHGEISSDAINIPPSERKLYCKGKVKIENNVWIGEGVAILPNVTIGENSIIGANSVITKDIPKNSVIGGNPARIIRTL